jgi:hypothetical protein
MAYQTFSVSQKDMDDYYLPKKDNFDKMITSISQNGYGQLIYNYNGPGDFTLNSYNVWDINSMSMVVLTADESTIYTEAQAGPNLWGVSGEEGIDFLQGLTRISGLARIKYCNSCLDGNGLTLPTITSFSNRFRYLKELKSNYGTDTGYIFYDYSLPVNQRWYPSVYDSVIGRYNFKNYLGVNKLEAQVSSETGIPIQDITSSIDSSEPIKPVTNTSSAIIDCCGLGLKYIIDGVYEIGSAVYTKTDVSAICFQVVGNGTDKPDNFDEYYPYKGGCRDCTSTYRCPKGGGDGSSGSSGGGR